MFHSILAYLSSFFLTLAFVSAMVSVHHYAAQDKKVWSQLALTFAMMYATMNSIVYYVQLVVVRTNPLSMSPQSLAPFSYAPGSAFFAIDMLGYGFLTLAMLFAAWVFVGGRLERSIRWLFVVNGLFSIPTLLYPAFLTSALVASSSSATGSYALLVWSGVFIPASILLALLFKQARQTIALVQVG